jgi:hypothetical protein
MFVIHLMMAPGGPKQVVKRGSEKCQNKHSVAIAGIDLCHIYIFVGPGVYSASDRNEYQKHKNNNVSGE